MARCYSCNNTLHKNNQSWEHIIPSALGSSIKSRRLLCRTCNEAAGREIDKALYDFCKPWILQYQVQPARSARTDPFQPCPGTPLPVKDREQVNRAISKTCFNFYYWKNRAPISEPTPLLCPHLLGLSTEFLATRPFHWIVLLGDPLCKLLVAYVELFGEAGFFVRLSTHYTERAIRQLLVYDPCNKQQIGNLPEPAVSRVFDQVGRGWHH